MFNDRSYLSTYHLPTYLRFEFAWMFSAMFLRYNCPWEHYMHICEMHRHTHISMHTNAHVPLLVLFLWRMLLNPGITQLWIKQIQFASQHSERRNLTLSTSLLCAKHRLGAFHTVFHLVFQQPWEGDPAAASHHWRQLRLTAEQQLAHGYTDGKGRAGICGFSIKSNCLGDAGSIWASVPFFACFPICPQGNCLLLCLGLRPTWLSSSGFSHCSHSFEKLSDLQRQFLSRISWHLQCF